MQVLLKGIARWWATSQATNIIIILAVTALGAGGIYIQQLRVKVAECEIADAAQQRIDTLEERIVGHETENLNEALDAIDEADDPCLDRRTSDILRNSEG